MSSSEAEVSNPMEEFQLELESHLREEAKSVEEIIDWIDVRAISIIPNDT